MDVFKEQLVKKMATTKEILLKAGMILLTGLIVIAAAVYSPFLGGFAILAIMAGVGAVYGCIYFYPLLNVEYEYILTNGEMDVDKILGKKKRKRLLTFDVTKAERFGPYDPALVNDEQFDNRIHACIAPNLKSTYFLTFEHHSLGKCLLLFNPNEEMLGYVKEALPRTAKIYE